jgi:hypothetical protein
VMWPCSELQEKGLAPGERQIQPSGHFSVRAEPSSHPRVSQLTLASACVMEHIRLP